MFVPVEDSEYAVVLSGSADLRLREVDDLPRLRPERARQNRYVCGGDTELNANSIQIEGFGFLTFAGDQQPIVGRPLGRPAP